MNCLQSWGSFSAPLRRKFSESADRYEKKSTLITSQLPVDKWHRYLEDPTLADAILDRVVYNA